jgi:division protein CdvB (Snf7/Vps24/ESCRT-III family)
LVGQFIDRWKEKEQQPSIVSKIKEFAKPSESLKQQINTVIQQIEVQKHKLNDASSRFEKRDAYLFMRTVKSLSERDTLRANVLAGELAEIRKVEKMLMHAALALESISIRLNTVSELGDIVTVLAPATSVLNNIRVGMAEILPDAGREIENIGGLLTEIVASTNQNTDVQINDRRVSAEAEKILEEAEIAAERRLKAQLPEVSTPPHGEKRAVET